MTATLVVPIRNMRPIRREGRRPGSMHAAMLGPRPGVWLTACGETLEDGPRGPIVQLTVGYARELIENGSPLICLRCDRVGDAVTIGGTA